MVIFDKFFFTLSNFLTVQNGRCFFVRQSLQPVDLPAFLVTYFFEKFGDFEFLVSLKKIAMF